MVCKLFHFYVFDAIIICIWQPILFLAESNKKQSNGLPLYSIEYSPRRPKELYDDDDDDDDSSRSHGGIEFEMIFCSIIM